MATFDLRKSAAMRPARPASIQRPLARPAPRPAPVLRSDEDVINAALNMQVPALKPQGPEQYDLKGSKDAGKKILTPQEQQVADRAKQAALVAARKARYFENMQYLSLLAQSAGVATEITPPITGDNIEALYLPVFTNNTNGAVRVQVFADFVNPGVGVVLSLTQDASDVGKVDELALIANGKTESVSVILMPTFSLFMRDRDAQFFPMQATDVVRVRVFDPAKLLAYDNMYPVMK